MCSLKFNTPACTIDVKIRDFDYINLIADQIYLLGEFQNPEMKEAIFIYLQNQLAKAHAIRMQDPASFIKPFYPASRQNSSKSSES